jgi:outer membrane biosynthesis protein TonB
MRKLLTNTPFVAGAALSIVVHGSALGVLGSRRLWKDDDKPDTVKVRIVETPKVEEPAPPPPPKPPEIKPPKKPVEKKIASERVPKTPPPKDPPKPIQGLSEDSFDKTGKGTVAAPMGNTMMIEDTGVRVKEPPPPMDVDLSSDPILIRE